VFQVAHDLVNEPSIPLLDRSDDRSEVLRLKGIGFGLLHTSEGRAQVIKSTVAIEAAQALDGTVEAEGAEVEDLDASFAEHPGTMTG
jgi:hypothetical protein